MIEELKSLTTALEAHTEAMNNLAIAMQAQAENGVTATHANGVAPGVVEYDEPILWIDNKTGEYGSCSNSAEWVAVKTNSTSVVKVPESKYKSFVAEQEAKKADSTEKQESKAKTQRKPKAKKDPEPEPETEVETDDQQPEVEIPEVDEEGLIKAFKNFMSQDLDKDERDERIAFVKPMLQRFGVNKATELEPADRGIAVRLLELKLEGFDIDPEAQPWEPLKVIADCEAGSDDDELV